MNVTAILSEKGRDVTTCAADATLLRVSEILNEERIGCVVVVDQDGKVCGIVSERDIVRAVARQGAGVLEEPVSVCMTKEVVTAVEADTLDQLMSVMTKGRFRHLPIMENDHLGGIVSIGDVVKMRIAEALMEAAELRAYIATG